MATSTRLSLDFSDSHGNLINMTYSNAKNNVTDAQVKALMQGIIANGSIFADIPVTIREAHVITTEAIPVDLS